MLQDWQVTHKPMRRPTGPLVIRKCKCKQNGPNPQRDSYIFSLSFSWVEMKESCGNFPLTFSFLKVVILLFKFFRFIYFKYMGFLPTCIICRLCTYNIHRGWRGHQIPWDWICRWLCVVMRMLGIEPRSSIRVVSAWTSEPFLQSCDYFTCSTFSPKNFSSSLEILVNFKNDSVIIFQQGPHRLFFTTALLPFDT